MRGGRGRGADRARAFRPAPAAPRAARLTGDAPHAQLGFRVQPAFLAKFGKEEKRRVCVDVHQFVACISVCHADTVNHPKSKQIFTLMDTQRKGEVVTDDFVHVFESMGGGAPLQPDEQAMVQRYIADSREKCAPPPARARPHFSDRGRRRGNAGLSHEALSGFLTANTASTAGES